MTVQQAIQKHMDETAARMRGLSLPEVIPIPFDAVLVDQDRQQVYITVAAIKAAFGR